MLLLALCLAATTAAAQTPVAIIAHQQVPADSIERARLLDFYTGEAQSWDDGVAVVVCDLKARDAVKETFYRFLGKSSSRMKSIWLKRKLAGEGDPPQAFQTEEALLEHVAETPGAIGFVRASKVRGGVKVLAEIEAGGG